MSSGAIVDWANQDLRYFFHGASLAATDQCHDELCKEVPWEGNPDVAGIGILVSYVSEIVLATAFVLAFFYFSLVHRRSYDSPFDSRHTKTANQSAVWTALNASIGIFWDSALLFGAAITIAAVVAIKTGHSAYTGLFVSVAAQLSTVVLIVTWPFYFPACKHPQYRWLGLAIVCALCIAAVVLQVPATGHRPDIIYSDFETHCFNSYKNYQAYHDFVSGSMSPTSLMNLHWVTVVIAGGTGSLAIIQFVVFLLGLPVSSVSRFLRRWGWLSRFLDRFLALFWLVNFGCMWMHLASFVELRSEVASTAGPSLKEGEFSFGQILALATWLPTIIDFVVVWRGHLGSIAYRLPLGVELQSSVDEEQQLSQPRENSIVPMQARATL